MTSVTSGILLLLDHFIVRFFFNKRIILLIVILATFSKLFIAIKTVSVATLLLHIQC